MQIGAINGAIIPNIRGDVKILDLLTVRVAHDVPQTPIVHALRTIFGIPDDFIDEIPEMKHESQLILLRDPLIFIDHASVRILCAVIRVLATDEGESYWSSVVLQGSCTSTADSAANSSRIG